MKKKIVSIIMIISLTVAFTGCASWDRGMKDINSDIGNGLDRTVTVYDYNGDVIKTYSGKIDIEESEIAGKVKFDLDGNKRIIIYNAPVIIEEK